MFYTFAVVSLRKVLLNGTEVGLGLLQLLPVLKPYNGYFLYPQPLMMFGSIGIKIGLIFVEIVQCVLYLCGGITEESFVKWHRGWPWTSMAFAIALSL